MLNQKEYEFKSDFNSTVEPSVAAPDPESGAFLTPRYSKPYF
jgi:hypothetical protein